MTVPALFLLCFVNHADVSPVAGMLVRALVPDWQTRGICIRVTA